MEFSREASIWCEYGGAILFLFYEKTLSFILQHTIITLLFARNILYIFQSEFVKLCFWITLVAELGAEKHLVNYSEMKFLKA